MSINLKKYQEKAVESLVGAVKSLLENEGTQKVCVFQAPTGSGKTLMTAKFIEEIIKDLPGEDLCFVWVSIGKGELHRQSKHALEKYFNGAPRVSLVEEEFSGGRERIVRNEVVVVNWEKIRSKDRETGDYKNVLMREGEKINFRDVLEKTREQRKIILIIDESHIGATAERTNELRHEINADVILEMSATPKIEFSRMDEANGTAKFVGVSPKEVIDAGIIKKELIINCGIDQIADDENDSQEVVLEAAYRKRLELRAGFHAEGAKINPLVLIQIPNAEAGDDKITAIRAFLSKKGITESSGRLGIWLSEQKSEDIDLISEPDNIIEFLVFKQAIDTGWDCPRAHILVKFRESHSETFEIQTVGRILRMPEFHHYTGNEALNIGYIYTNVQSIVVKKEEYNPNIIKHLRATRKKVYKPIGLPSYFRSRVDYGDVTSSFDGVFEAVACEYFKVKDGGFFSKNVELVEKKGVVLNLQRYQEEIIRDAKIEAKRFDEIYGSVKAEHRVRLTIAGNDLQAIFEQVIKNNLGSFRNIRRSVPKIKTTIYLWFRKYLASQDWAEESMLVQKIFVTEGNRKIFERILADAIERYRVVREKEITARAKENEQVSDFDVPAEMFYNQFIDEKLSYEKYVLDPCYLNVDRSSPEKEFEKFLEDKRTCDKIVWWWKNGEDKKDYFGIKYEYPTGVVHTFYPDYMVCLNDGRIGVIEVKDSSDRDGSTSTKAKAEALQDYLKIQVKSGKRIFGGIAIKVDKTWRLNQKPTYNWEKCLRRDWSEWEDLLFA